MSDNVGKVFNLTGGGGGNGTLKLQSITVKTPPNKTIYKSGESFDPTGMVVEANYGYNLTSDVTGYNVTPAVLTDGVTEVTITYTEGRVTKTATTPVTVEKVLTSIEVTTNPTKTEYNYLENFAPAGMAVTAHYSDESTETVTGYTYPTTAFSTIGAQIVNIEYSYEGVTKSTTLSVTVNAIQVPVPTQKNVPSYDGDAKTPVWNGYDSVKMAISGTTDGVNAGTYTAKFTLIYGYVFPDGTDEATADWTIDKAVIPALPTQSNVLAADGTTKVPTWDGYVVGQLTIGGDQSGTEAGDYSCTFTPTANYKWWDGTTDSKSATWTITSVIVSIPTQKNIPTYDGTDKTPEWNNFDTENCTVQVTPATNAGEHSAEFTLRRGMWSDGSTAKKTVTWTIKRAPIAAVPAQTNIPTYDGNPKTPSWDANYSSDKMTVSVEAKVNAGTSYSASFTPDANHCWADGSTIAKTATWSIKRTTIATVPSQSVALTYTGNEQAVTLGNYNSAQLTLGGEIKGTNAGEYSANVTPTANYQWSDGSITAKTVKWTIGKAAGSLNLSATSVTLNPSNLTKEITVTRAGDGAITASSSNTGVVTVTVSGTKITIAHVNQTSGSATITVKVAAGTNHTAPANKTIAVTASFREYLYGYDLTIADSNPATRVSYPSDVENSSFAKAVMNFGSSFSSGGWPSTPGQKFMPQPCMLKYDGTVAYYLDPNYLTKKADGSASDVANINFGGNAMMEWPKIYVKRWESNGVYHFRCSDVKVDGEYECWSNYDKNNKEIPHFYTPIFFGSKDSSGRMRSISGQANMVNTTAQQEIDAAKLNGANIWYTEVLADRQLINDLLTMMFKSTDLQVTAGMGVVSASAAIAPGTMNTKGMFWGSNDKTSGVKVFGMENWWGNIWRRIAGWMYVNSVQKVKLTRGTKDGTTVADYNITGDGYLSLSDSALSGSSGGYISGMKTERHGRYPKTLSGSSTTYEADTCYYNSGTRYAIVGGSWNYALRAGPFIAGLTNAPSYASTSIGAALSCKPLAAA